MKGLETRYPCPVCLGVKMEKIALGTETGPALRASRGAAAAGDRLTIDHCPRCGGVWFEEGEVQQLRRTDAGALWRVIARREGVHAMRCHGCGAHVSRSDAACGACGWRCELSCPECDRSMRVAKQGGVRLDYCPHCKGVWFDHDELAGVWKMEAKALAARRAGEPGEGLALSEVLLLDPFLMYYGVHAAGHALGAAAQVISASGSAEAIGGIAGAAGDVASGLFETIVEIISGIFG